MVVTRSMTGTEEADTKKKGKANETMAVTTSMARTKKTADKSKKRRRLTVKEMQAYSMFMITDFLKRYYQNHPLPTTGLIQRDAEKSGSIEWFNMSETEKALWVEKLNNMKAAGKTLYQLRRENYYLC